MCLSIFDQLFDWEIYLNFICFAYDRSPRPLWWHWLPMLENYSIDCKREREIDAISVDWRNPPNLWLRFSQQEKNKIYQDFYRINHKLSAEHNGSSIKNDLRNGFVLDVSIFGAKIQLTRIITEMWNWAKWMNQMLSYAFGMNDFVFFVFHLDWQAWKGAVIYWQKV